MESLNAAKGWPLHQRERGEDKVPRAELFRIAQEYRDRMNGDARAGSGSRGDTLSMMRDDLQRLADMQSVLGSLIESEEGESRSREAHDQDSEQGDNNGGGECEGGDLNENQ